MATEARLVLTETGRQKLISVALAARAASEEGLRQAMIGGRAVAAAAAPSPEDEARLLSQGLAEGTVRDVFSSGGTIVGTNEEGRFLRMQGPAAGMMSTREAILDDPVVITSGRDQVRGTTGRAERINAITGFSWITRRRGLQGPTFPFNRRLLQAWEWGGAVWRVVPRPENRSRMLEPEPGLAVRAMTKTVLPRGMFRRARQFATAEGRPAIMARIREAVRQVGRA